MMFIIRAGIQILADHPRLYWTRHCTPGKEWFRIQKRVPDDPLWTAKQDSITLPKHVGPPGPAPLDRARALVAPRRRRALARERPRVLRPLVRERRVAAARPDELAGDPRRRLRAAPVPLARLAGRQRLGRRTTACRSSRTSSRCSSRHRSRLITGLGMSPALSTRFKRVSKVLSIQVARSLHFLVLCWFLFFIVVHVTLVFTTGLLRNLEPHLRGHRHRRLARVLDVRGVDGRRRDRAGSPRRRSRCAIRAWVQRIGFALVGPAQRLFEHVDATPGEYTREGHLAVLLAQRQVPRLRRVPRAVRRRSSRTTGCASTAWSRIPSSSTSKQLRALPTTSRSRSTSASRAGPASRKWGGVSMRTILDLVKPTAEAKWVVFYSLGDGPDKGRLLRRPSDRADELPADDARLRHERRAAVVRPRCTAAAAQRGPARVQAGEVDRRASSSSPTSPRSAAARAATTRTTSSSAIASRSISSFDVHEA